MNRQPSLLEYRKATLADAETIKAIIALSVNGLGSGHYNETQRRAALASAFGLDTELINDQTYFVVESRSEIVGCGGWSRRKTLFGGDDQPGRQSELLDPGFDCARIRAFFVRPDWARRGIGRRLLAICEAEARAQGFRSVALMATLPGHALYLACGYIGNERVEFKLPGDVGIHFIPMTKSLV